MDQHPLVTGHTRVKRQISRRLRAAPTPAERRLWQELRANRLAHLHFRRQQNLFGFIADFYCHAARLAIELDGVAHQHRTDYDRERDQILDSHGITTLRFPNERIDTDLPRVLNEIRTACLDRLTDHA